MSEISNTISFDKSYWTYSEAAKAVIQIHQAKGIGGPEAITMSLTDANKLAHWLLAVSKFLEECE